MALAFLNGSTSTVDVSLDTVSIKCAFGRWSFQFVRGATDRVVFCDTGWVSESPGRKQMLISLDGYLTTGTTYSDPSIYVTKSTPVAFVGTVTTSCTVTCDANCFGDGGEVVAAANAGRSVTLRSSGAVTTAWVTS